MTPSLMRLAACLALSLAVLAVGNLVRAQEKVHGANSVFLAPTVRIAWAVRKGTGEDTTLVFIRVVNSVAQYRQVRLDGVDPFSNSRKTLVPTRPLDERVDLSVPRSQFVDYPSSEIRLYGDEATTGDRSPDLTVYYLGIPDTTPEFASAREAEAYLDKALRR
jgi:hypothetical protein